VIPEVQSLSNQVAVMWLALPVADPDVEMLAPCTWSPSCDATTMRVAGDGDEKNFLSRSATI
jgi:hypothetical protein